MMKHAVYFNAVLLNFCRFGPSHHRLPQSIHSHARPVWQ